MLVLLMQLPLFLLFIAIAADVANSVCFVSVADVAASVMFFVIVVLNADVAFAVCYCYYCCCCF